ncbi:MAG: hypothetical protein GX134_14930 [candidate division WS1 bacterium]|jgi:hypothetical protein|nr:hypothetical protein [candidate division WS1 bacterium]
MSSWLRALSSRYGLRPVFVVLLVVTVASLLVGWVIPQSIRSYRQETERKALAAGIMGLASQAPLLAATQDIAELATQETAMQLGDPDSPPELVVEARRLLGVAGDEPLDALVADIRRTAAQRAAEGVPPYLPGVSPEDYAQLDALKLCFYAITASHGELSTLLQVAADEQVDITTELDRLVYSSCTMADAVSSLDLGTSLLLDATATKRNALIALRAARNEPPQESALGASIDELILEMNRHAVIIQAEDSREADPLLDSLRTAGEEAIRQGAFVRAWQERDARVREALADAQPVGERLRAALIAAGEPDPRGGMKEYLEFPLTPTEAPDSSTSPGPSVSLRPPVIQYGKPPPMAQ